jgi:hypothetical protein
MPTPRNRQRIMNGAGCLPSPWCRPAECGPRIETVDVGGVSLWTPKPGCFLFVTAIGGGGAKGHNSGEQLGFASFELADPVMGFVESDVQCDEARRRRRHGGLPLNRLSASTFDGLGSIAERLAHLNGV